MSGWLALQTGKGIVPRIFLLRYGSPCPVPLGRCLLGPPPGLGTGRTSGRADDSHSCMKQISDGSLRAKTLQWSATVD